MLSDHGLALVGDVSQLPQVNLARLDNDDRLVVQTRLSFYELVLAVLNIYNEPPIWVAHTRGLEWLRPRTYALIGANTNYHQLAVDAEIELSALELNCLIQGFPMVLGDMHDGCVVMGPIEHVWLNTKQMF